MRRPGVGQLGLDLLAEGADVTGQRRPPASLSSDPTGSDISDMESPDFDTHQRLLLSLAAAEAEQSGTGTILGSEIDGARQQNHSSLSAGTILDLDTADPTEDLHGLLSGPPRNRPGSQSSSDSGDLLGDFRMQRQAATQPAQPQSRPRAQAAHTFLSKGGALSLEETCREYIEALEVCQQRVSSWNEEELLQEFALTEQHLKSTRDEYAVTLEELRQLQERQAELTNTRENLLEELQYMRDAPTRGCGIS